MAVTGSVILSRNIGIASTAQALANSNVTSSRWCLLTTGSIFLAFALSSGVPASIKTVSCITSRERRPRVNPEHSPKMGKRIRHNIFTIEMIVNL